MAGELAALSTFGAKLISVFADPDRPGRTRHRGVVVAYDGETGAVSCIADAWLGCAITIFMSSRIPRSALPPRLTVTCKDGSFQIVKGIEISDFGRKRMDATLKELHEERDGVKHLLGK